MAEIFGAQPFVLRQSGDKLISQSVSFNKNVEKLYNTVHQLTASSYTSPASRAIAADIERFHGDLDLMTNTIKEYGNYLIRASQAINANENRIMDNYTGGSNGQ